MFEERSDRKPFFGLGLLTQPAALRAREQFRPVSALGLLTRLAEPSALFDRIRNHRSRIRTTPGHLQPASKEKRPEACGPEASISCGCPQDW